MSFNLHDDYPLPARYLFLDDEEELNLWDFLHETADHETGIAGIDFATICGNPPLFRNRGRLRTWLRTHAADQNGILSFEPELFPAHVPRRSKKGDLKVPGGKASGDLVATGRYLVALCEWSQACASGLPKPRGYHRQAWVHELMSIEERWVLNLLLRETVLRPGILLDRIDRALAELLAICKKSGPALTRPVLLRALEDLIEDGLVRRQGQRFVFERATLQQHSAPWPRDDHTAARRVIAERLSVALDQRVAPAEPAVELIRHFHQRGGIRLREVARLYRHLQNAQPQIQPDDYEAIHTEIENRYRRRDHTTAYKTVLKEFLKKREAAARFRTSERLHLRLDHQPVAGATFRFKEPLAGRPSSLVLKYDRHWRAEVPRDEDRLEFWLWLPDTPLIALGQGPATSAEDEITERTITLMPLLPGHFDLSVPATLLVRAGRPLPGFTVHAWLVAGWPRTTKK